MLAPGWQALGWQAPERRAPELLPGRQEPAALVRTPRKTYCLLAAGNHNVGKTYRPLPAPLRIVLVTGIVRAESRCRHRAILAAASSCARSFPAVPPPCTERRDQRLRARSFHFWEYLFLRPTGNASHITKVAGFGSAGNACRALRETDVPKTETNSASFSNTRGWRLSLAPSARPDQQRARRGP